MRVPRGQMNGSERAPIDVSAGKYEKSSAFFSLPRSKISQAKTIHKSRDTDAFLKHPRAKQRECWPVDHLRQRKKKSMTKLFREKARTPSAAVFAGWCRESGSLVREPLDSPEPCRRASPGFLREHRRMEGWLPPPARHRPLRCRHRQPVDKPGLQLPGFFCMHRPSSVIKKGVVFFSRRRAMRVGHGAFDVDEVV